MLFALAWQDHAVVVLYVGLLAGMGYYFARRRKSAEEYFLAGRSVPWMAVGLSIMATLMSSLTYLAEPGEVWQSGLTSLLGKFIAIVAETGFVLLFFIPFLMRFRFTSLYEYLGYRFGLEARILGVVLFCCLVVVWMGFVVLTMSRAVSAVGQLPLALVVVTVGMVGTVYTIVGGMRAVIWKDVFQVVLMFGGCVICLVYVSWISGGTWLPDWIAATQDYQAGRAKPLTLVSLDPFTRNTIVTFGLMMFVWHACTHVGNQMVVQRYFTMSNLASARRGFLTAVGASLLVNSLLVFVGLALVYFYRNGYGTLTLDPTNKKEADLIFPTFMVTALPPGLGGAVLTAVLSAAMSTIDAGVNAIATVLSVERRRMQGLDRPETLPEQRTEIRFARIITLAAGLLITAAAFGLDHLTGDRNILEMMPRSFNCFLVPIGGLVLLGMFVPYCGQRTAILAAVMGFVAAGNLAYAQAIYGLEQEVSFTWVLPGALLIVFLIGMFGGLFDRSTAAQRDGLTWFTQNQRPQIPPHLLAESDHASPSSEC
ncbi:MAG: sodium/solute symporter [Bacteroidales bacterium]|nr:sodium/solute symporter [Bacteroidales bacterium]